MARKIPGWESGMLVYRRNEYAQNGDHTVDENTLYVIKAIGTRQATLQRVDKVTGQPMGYSGHRIRLWARDVALAARAQSRTSTYRHLYPYEWGEIFVAVGEAGWDPERNY